MVNKHDKNFFSNIDLRNRIISDPMKNMLCTFPTEDCHANSALQVGETGEIKIYFIHRTKNG